MVAGAAGQANGYHAPLIQGVGVLAITWLAALASTFLIDLGRWDCLHVRSAHSLPGSTLSIVRGLSRPAHSGWCFCPGYFGAGELSHRLPTCHRIELARRSMRRCSPAPRACKRSF